MYAHLEGGGYATAGPIDVRPPVEHVMGTEEQQWGPAQACTDTNKDKVKNLKIKPQRQRVEYS